MSVIRTFALSAALVVSPALLAPAGAMTAAPASSFAAPSAFAASPAQFVFADQLVPGRPSRLDRVDGEAAREAAQSYFDFDALITFGALVLGGGAMAAIAVGPRRKDGAKATAEARDEDWRESVFRAVQADLAEFTRGYRRAA